MNAALQPALSGAANVRLGCLAMGMTPDQAESMKDEVVRLSALGDAINRPMGGYSSGMSSRLRFAIAVAAVRRSSSSTRRCRRATRRSLRAVKRQ